MRASHREIFQYETGRRLETFLRRVSEVTWLYPRLAPGVHPAEVRRTIHRLRTGAIQSIDPRLPSHVLADVLEGSLAQDTLIRELAEDGNELKELGERLGRRSR